MAQPVSSNNGNSQLISLPGQTRGQAVPFSDNNNTSTDICPRTTTSTSNSNSRQAVPFSRLIENNTDAADDTLTDPRPRTIIFCSNPQINASIQDRLTSYDQTTIFNFNPVDIIIIGAFNRTQIQNRPSYLNAFLIQSRGINAKSPCTDCQKGKNKFDICRTAPGFFGSCCASCKWRDHGSRCSLYDKNKRKIDLDEERQIDLGIEEIEEEDEDADEWAGFSDEDADEWTGFSDEDREEENKDNEKNEE